MTVDPRSVPVRFTHLKAMARSPLHYLHAVQQGRPDSAALRRGRIVHWQTLGGMPDDEDGRVVIYDGERKGNAWKEFAAANDGAEIVTRKEWSAAEPIAAAVEGNRLARMLLKGALLEHPIQWAIGSRRCSSRLDALGPEYVVDLKTTTDASVIGFTRQAWRMGYHAQLAWYMDAARSTGREVKDAYLIAVEVNAPYAVTVVRLTHALIEEGRRMCRSWWETLRTCEDSNDWPAYSESMVQWDVPAWIEHDDADEPDDPEGGGEEEAA